MLNIELTGIEETLAYLNGLAKEELFWPAIKATMDEWQYRMSNYPAMAPNQKYVRTFTLQDGWLNATPEIAVESGLNFTATSTNFVEYVVDVQGDGSQERAFQGRWQTDQQIADNPEFLNFIQDQFTTILENYTGA